MNEQAKQLSAEEKASLSSCTSHTKEWTKTKLKRRHIIVKAEAWTKTTKYRKYTILLFYFFFFFFAITSSVRAPNGDGNQPHTNVVCVLLRRFFFSPSFFSFRWNDFFLSLREHSTNDVRMGMKCILRKKNILLTRTPKHILRSAKRDPKPIKQRKSHEETNDIYKKNTHRLSFLWSHVLVRIEFLCPLHITFTSCISVFLTCNSFWRGVLFCFSFSVSFSLCVQKKRKRKCTQASDEMESNDWRKNWKYWKT